MIDRRTIGIIAIVLGLLPWGSLAHVSAQEDGAAAEPVERTLAQDLNDLDTLPAPPPTTARAVFAADIDAGQPLFAVNATERLAPASTVKIATALVAISVLELDQVVTIEESDTVDITIFSNMQLQTGDQLNVRDLLYGLLLPSGNDAARAIARVAGAALPGGVSDPTAAFITEMNRLSQALGAVDSNFLHPAGEDQPEQYTTARDLTILAAALLDDPFLSDIVATVEWDVSITGANVRSYRIFNTNGLLGETGIIGIKTGSTEAAGACLVTGAAYTANNRVVIVVLGSDLTYAADGTVAEDSRFSDTIDIIRGIQDSYQWVDPTSPGTVAGLADEMAAWQVRLADNPEIVIPTGQDAEITYRLQLGPEANPGDEVGRVLFFIGNEQIADFPVFQI